ncbi:MAG: metallophosphoesterase family protein [Burkholderiales bacterium]
MIICIVSDSHDHADLLAAAVEAAQAQGAQAIIHCGDIIGANTLRGLQRFGLPVHAVHGNNLGDFMALTRLTAKPDSVVRYYGDHADFELAGKRIFVTHYPHIARGMACTGDYDLVCCGHSHKALIERIGNVRGGNTLMINPGTVAGISAPPTYAIGDLRSGEFQIA